jgi:carbonic anhydrase
MPAVVMMIVVLPGKSGGVRQSSGALTSKLLLRSNYMRLFEAIIDANHRAVAGDASAGLHPADFADSLPVIALTCVDPRLNAFFPNALALPAEQFIWLRNAGNLITGPLSSTMRSLALACAVKGGEEIAIIGHTDCQIAKTTTMVLLEKLKELGVDRARLPDNVNEFFGTFGSERQNVIKACDIARQSPLIGPKIPVHGLLLDIATGKLDWVVNGYETLHSVALAKDPTPPHSLPAFTSLGDFKGFDLGEMRFPETKIGEVAAQAQEVIKDVQKAAESVKATAHTIVEMAEKHWPKTPEGKLPPLRVKKDVPPPLRPNPKFPRQP